MTIQAIHTWLRQYLPIALWGLFFIHLFCANTASGDDPECTQDSDCNPGYFCSDRGNCLYQADAGDSSCTPLQKKCASDTAFQECLSNGIWGQATECNSEENCLDGVCGCADLCTAGQKKCETQTPGNIYTCASNSTGCLTWKSDICDPGKTCVQSGSTAACECASDCQYYVDEACSQNTATICEEYAGCRYTTEEPCSLIYNTCIEALGRCATPVRETGTATGVNAMYYRNPVAFGANSENIALILDFAEGFGLSSQINLYGFLEATQFSIEDNSVKETKTITDHNFMLIYYYPALATSPAGGFVVAWTQFLTIRNSIKVALFNTDFEPVKETTATVTNNYAAGTMLSDVALFSNQQIVVTWQGIPSLNPEGQSQIFFNLLDSGGQVLNSDRRVDESAEGNAVYPQVATLSNTGFAVVWEWKNSAGPDSDIFGKSFNPAGEAISSLTPINHNTSGLQTRPVITPLPNGNYAVCWTNLSDGQRNIVARIFNPSLSPLTSEIDITTPAQNYAYHPEISVIKTGEVVITWKFAAEPGYSYDIYARVFQSDLSPITSEFKVNEMTVSNDPSINGDTTSEPPVIKIGLNPLVDRGFVISWSSLQNAGANGSSYEKAYYRIFP